MGKRVIVMLLWFLGAAMAVGAVFVAEIVIALFGPKEPPFANPSHAPLHFGTNGPLLTYVVIGDSTGAGQGAPYEDGIAIGTAKVLATKYRVSLSNYSISGATTGDVVKKELAEAAALKPDLVLLSAGANDSTHFIPSQDIRKSLDTIVTTLRDSSPNVKVLVTGCPQMGSVPRFAQPLRWFAGTQTARVNRVFAEFVPLHKNVYWAHIAADTGPIFEQDPTLFYVDQFHPNTRGYAVWNAVLARSIHQIEPELP